MKKIKYYYNTNTLRYEKLETPLRVKLLRVLGFISAAIVTALIIVSIAYRYFPSANEKKLLTENERLEEQYENLDHAAGKLSQRLKELEERDNEIYRVIFEANPIPDSSRAMEIAQQKEWKMVTSMTNSELENSIVQTLNNLNNRMSNQDASYADITKFIANKEEMLASTPAIQPVSNSDLKRVASGYGSRIDPVYKTIKFHAGLDFSAPQGTPIYATANGVARTAGNLGNGYGNHVVINHGYGYETLYGHMFKVKVKAGQRVKRGEVIGWVGSTGKSTGPHCHYEVHKNGRPVDPIYFFYNDLTPEQFDRMLKMAASSNQSFD
ncbi:peptidoglycan DD-metalloendopeptidase family protein [Pseudoflavitalea sp. G-6-1-2]|uniref:M23 family metallopeptidase n=1 Tax=Pseudoflavitalea sp. G-6-1-2 TaxID=2728841 RepID=UPI00146DC5A4|nr:M23 family metallopeptidase [Pseudoflavitalea sp. G-6-1-2]NML20403.1 peptidoglycan DD-metalloendopeptidase family protein [Pseudoflavitalea sp. G-6-1-2]